MRVVIDLASKSPATLKRLLAALERERITVLDQHASSVLVEIDWTTQRLFLPCRGCVRLPTKLREGSYAVILDTERCGEPQRLSVLRRTDRR